MNYLKNVCRLSAITELIKLIQTSYPLIDKNPDLYQNRDPKANGLIPDLKAD